MSKGYYEIWENGEPITHADTSRDLAGIYTNYNAAFKELKNLLEDDHYHVEPGTQFAIAEVKILDEWVVERTLNLVPVKHD